MTPLETLRLYASLLPSDEQDVLKAIDAILRQQKRTRKCLFLTIDDVQQQGGTMLSFERARTGEWECWGISDGETMGIITETGGLVHVVPPSFVKMLEG